MHRIITFIYFSGIIISAALALTLGFGGLSFPGDSIVFLAVGAVQMISLICLGYSLKLTEGCFRIFKAGMQVENAGYLHTLIGFMMAVLEIRQDQFEIENIAFPIATALVTSILGWLFGGQIKARAQEEAPSLEKATEQILTSSPPSALLKGGDSPRTEIIARI